MEPERRGWIVFRALRLVLAESPAFAFGSAVLAAWRSLQPIVVLWIVGLLLDEVVSGPARVWTPTLTILLSALFLVTVGSALLNQLAGALISTATDRLNHELESRLIRTVNGFGSIRVFEDPHFHDRLKIAQGSGLTAVSGVFNDLLSLLGNLIAIAAATSLLAQTSVWLFALLVIMTVPGVLLQYRFSRKTWELNHQQALESRRMQHWREILLHESFAKEVRVYGLHSYFARLWNQSFESQVQARRTLSLAAARASGFGMALSAAGVAGALGAAIYTAKQGRASPGNVFVTFGLVQQTSGAIYGLLSQIAVLLSQRLHVADYFKFIDMAAAPTARTQSTLSRLAVGIDIRDVRFTYPGQTSPALRSLSLTIPAGSTVALVGRNGSGKSTLVKLLTRLYDPDQGAILADGVDIRDFDLQSYRSMVAAVFQDYSRYCVSVGLNIGVGDIEVADDMARCRVAARRSGLDGFIDQLPSRYNTLIGKQFPKGIELSGGQWQKLAIARAFFRNADVLILDEPTASLDAQTETEVFRDLAALSRGRTTVLVSHRFSTIKMADLIVVLEGGTVCEQGNHDELLRRNGLYASLFRMQAKPYTDLHLAARRLGVKAGA